ncbi:ankyrin repeat-containing protein At5g02620-like [Mangifera indica]|uniref:ankyrin repeat-containing protein At5g02620-like n=1 Tax=Mangifera indica TaxID=29780 RepID=UPI001CF9DE09|nr:ankyrin repeat-containing protein At5g02620-like [Mangifera indica]XP_044461412.1 ankyrin repeat-containing protein At5g02620-like [Mangifera indica]
MDRRVEMADTGNRDSQKPPMHKPYQAALNDKWESLKDFYKDNVSLLFIPVTPAGDNAFHLAVFSKSSEPLQSLLEFSRGDDFIKYSYLEKNGYGNTPLHEAAANGNLKAVMALDNHNSKLLEVENVVENENEFLAAVNKRGETPLFKAAAFGKIEVVEYLAPKSLKTETRYIEGKTKEVTKLKDVHCQSKRNMPGATDKEGMEKVPDASILHVAITGNHFETALYLLDLDESLATLKDRNGQTSLHLLATMRSAFESGYRWGTWIHRVFYFCLPISDDANDDKKATTKISKGWLILLRKICALVSSSILEKKRNHKLALKLAERLIEKDSSWELAPDSQFEEDQPIPPTGDAGDNRPTALLLAAERGIVEIVDRILEECPQLVEQENDMNENILHVAIKHRQFDIFNRVKNMKIPMTRLVRKVDKYGCTILHHAAVMRPQNTKIHPAGPVYQLQEEIKWYKRVEKITPTHYAMLHDETCEQLFNLNHNELLVKAQQWIKGTSQSCSAVAVLVATVVFAAAYTVPGGSNDNGYPIFLNNSLFLVFTVMDVIALASSLTSVVMFLSVLSSPSTYDEFHHELPRKLTVAFSLLFISLATTMIAFAATLLLIVRLEKPRWTTTLIYTAAFFPVSIFALMNFPVYTAFGKTLLKLYRRLSKNWPVKKPAPTKNLASGQGSIADHNKYCLQV